MPSIEFDQEAIENKIVEQAVEKVVSRYEEWDLSGLEERVKKIIESTVTARCDAIVKPIIERGIEAFTFQVTNRFGEGDGKPTTLTEYIVGLAEVYLQGRVDYQGKPQKPDSYRYSENQTMLCWMIKEHLQYSISIAMKDAVKQVINGIAPALAETCEIQIRAAVTDLTARRG